MYGVKQLKFDASYPDPACDGCNNKHLSLFSLGEYCKVYDNKSCCFSDLAKDQIHLCKECVFALRKTKVFQTRCFNAQKIMLSYFNLMYREYEHMRHHQQQEAAGAPSLDTVRRDLQQLDPTVASTRLACGCIRRRT